MIRIVVTGIGAVTPLANNFQDSWSLVKKGTSGIGKVTKFNVDGIPWQMAGEVKAFDPSIYLLSKEIRTTDLFVQYALAAASMAFADSNLNSPTDKFDDYGVIIGSSRGGIGSIEREMERLSKRDTKENFCRLSPYLMPSSTIGIASSTVAQKLKLKGKCFGISCACSSGAVAIGEAYRAIKSGYSKVILAGGAEAPICKLCIVGYGSSGALSTGKDSTASMPFDRKRDGFVLSEGATILVLEEYEHALKRDCKIYGEIIGYSNTTDAYHVTKPALDGEIRCMKVAIDDAGISPKYIDYVSAHATSTPLGDHIESQAIDSVFGDNPKIPVSAIKSMTGHMLASSGAFEAACTLMSLVEGVVPPTINILDKDPACDINVINELKNTPLRVALSNSFGFGGINASLVMKKID